MYVVGTYGIVFEFCVRKIFPRCLWYHTRFICFDDLRCFILVSQWLYANRGSCVARAMRQANFFEVFKT